MSSSDKEVLLVTERFHPDTTSSTGQYMTDIAIGLQERGLNVTVVTRKIRGHSDDSTQQEIEEAGVSVKRAPIPDLTERSLVFKFLNWLTFLAYAVPFLLLYGDNDRDCEVVFVTYPAVLPPIMWAVCRLRQWEYTYIVYDYYPQAAIELGYISRTGFIHRIWTKVNQHLLLDATNIIALGPRMREEIITSLEEQYRTEFDTEKIHIIHNWADDQFITPQYKEDNWFAVKHDTTGKFTLIYSGNIGEFHDLETIVEGMAEIENPDTKALIIGEGDNKKRIEELADKEGVLNETVELLPYQPWETVPDSLTAGDVSIVAVNPEFEGLCVSSKLYSAMATGQPVLVIAEETADESRIVEEANAGKQVSPGDLQGVVDAITHWKNNPEIVNEQGRNAREAFEDNFTEQKSVAEYYSVLSES